ncbi:hypothetical protein ANN_15860 [Periplaneta americana]|uniref:Uncharacterized protein n=1 Tax=Periplaneta americana TaxID=6978 RepID=A0ABQ8SIM4_PERAM|nr:hypothetical protein ANN_15860 [Periplaneta americana]
MAALASCYVLLLVAVSSTTGQWSKPIPTADRRSSSVSEDWVPVASAVPEQPEPRQASILQPPPAYQPAAQSAYIQQTLSAQQREIQNHFNTQGLLPALFPTPQQFSAPQQGVSAQQTSAASQQQHPSGQRNQQQPSGRLINPQLISAQASQQQPLINQQSLPEQLNFRQQLPNQQLPSGQLSSQQQLLNQQLHSGQLRNQQTLPNRQLLSGQLSNQQALSNQQIHSGQQSVQQVLSNQQLHSGQLSAQQSLPNQQLHSGQLNAQQSLPNQQLHSGQLSAQQSLPNQQLHSGQLSAQQVLSNQQLHSGQLSAQQSLPNQQLHSGQQSPQQSLPNQQVLSGQLSNQQTLSNSQLYSGQLNNQQVLTNQQLYSGQLTSQQALSNQPLSSGQLSQQQPAVQQLVPEQLSQQQRAQPQQQSAVQQLPSGQLNYQQTPSNQLSKQHTVNQITPQRGRRPRPTTTSTTPEPQEEVQLLYVPVETLRQQHQASLERQQQQLRQELQSLKPKPTTEQPITTPEPYQPPLSVYMGLQGDHNIKLSDVVKVLKESKSISVLDTVGPNSPQVFVGPSTLQAPEGYAKFELPYLSALESNRVERKVDKPPFFVAPLSFKPPPGYSKIPFPAPHVGSVVVGNVTELLHDKEQPRKTYSLPAELPPINPELPSLVNSLQDQRNVLLLPQQQAVTKFLQAVQQVGLETSTERYTRHKVSRYTTQEPDVTTKPSRHTNKHFRQRGRPKETPTQEFTVTTVQPQYLESIEEKKNTPLHQAQVPSLQPQYKEQDARYPTYPDDAVPLQSHNPENTKGPTKYTAPLDTFLPSAQEDSVPDYSALSRKQPQYNAPQEHTTFEPDIRTVTPAYKPKYSNQQTSPIYQTQTFVQDTSAPEKQKQYNNPPSEQVYSREPVKYINNQESLPTITSQYSVTEPVPLPKHTIPQENASTRRPQYLVSEDEPSYTTSRDVILQRQQYVSQETQSELKTPKYIASQADIPQRQAQYQDQSVVSKSKYVKENSQFSIREPSTNPSTYSTVKDDIPIPQTSYSDEDLNVELKSTKDSLIPVVSQDHRIITENPTKYAVTQNDFQFQQEQYSQRNPTRPVEPPNYASTRGDISLQTVRPQISPSYTSSVQEGGALRRPQQPVYNTTAQQVILNPSQQSIYSNLQDDIQTTQKYYQSTEDSTSGEQIKYANPQENLSPRLVQYSVPSSRPSVDDTYQLLEAEPAVSTTTTTTTAPVYTTPSRRNRGRHRHTSSFSTTTSAPRSRTPSYSRGRRPVSRTTSEPTSTGDQVSPFESSRQSSERAQTHRFETPRSRSRTRSRTRSTTTTTTTTTPAPQQNTDLYQDEIYATVTSTQHSRTDTVTEDFLQFAPPQGSQVTRTKLLRGQDQFYTGDTPQSQSRLPADPPSNVQIDELNSYTQVSSTPSYSAVIPNGHADASYIPLGSSPQAGISNEESFRQPPNSQNPTGQGQYVQTSTEHFIQTPVYNEQILRNQNIRNQGDYDQISNGHLVNNQIPNRQLINAPNSKTQLVPDYYDPTLTAPEDNRQLPLPAGPAAGTETPIISKDAFQPQQLQETIGGTTQRQYSSPPRTHSVTPSEVRYKDTSDSQIVTSERTPSVTQKAAFVRIRGRLRGRQRVTPQPTEQPATIPTIQPEVLTTPIARKHTNFLNRGSARKTQAPTTTPTAETTTPPSDKVYTVRPARRPQQAQTKLTTRGRIRRPTRPTTTTVAPTITSASDHRLNEVPYEFTTEIVPTTRRYQLEYDPVQQYQPRRHQYQSIQRHQQDQQYQQNQQDDQYQRYQQDQQDDQYQRYQQNQKEDEYQQNQKGGQYQQNQKDDQYQQNQKGDQYQRYQQNPQDDQYQQFPDNQQYYQDQQYQQYQTVERYHPTDQTSLPSDSRPHYATDDPEHGAESQWSTRTLAANSSNAIPVVAKSESITTEQPTTEAAITTTEATPPLVLTPSPAVSTTAETTETSKPGHSRRRGNWVRVRVRPQQQPQDIFETAESQNVATVAAANQIPGESTVKQMTKSPGYKDELFSASVQDTADQENSTPKIEGDFSSSAVEEDFGTTEITTVHDTATSTSSSQNKEAALSNSYATNDEITVEDTKKFVTDASSGDLDGVWNEEKVSEYTTKPSDDSGTSTTISPESTTEQRSYLSSLFSTLDYYGNSGKDADKNLNWGGYDDWWNKNYANHRPYYSDDKLNRPDDAKKKITSGSSIWEMDSFRDYEDLSEQEEQTNKDDSNTSTTKLQTSTESNVGLSGLEDYPNYQTWDDVLEEHNGKHSVKKANPEVEEEVKDNNVKGEKIDDSSFKNPPEVSQSDENILTTAYPATSEEKGSELVTEQPGYNVVESTTNVPNATEQKNVHQTTTEFSVFSTSSELSTTEQAITTEKTQNNTSSYETEAPSDEEISSSTEAASTTESSSAILSTEPVVSTDPSSLYNTEPK